MLDSWKNKTGLITIPNLEMDKRKKKSSRDSFKANFKFIAQFKNEWRNYVLHQ